MYYYYHTSSYSRLDFVVLFFHVIKWTNSVMNSLAFLFWVLLLFTNVIRNSNLLAIALTSVQQPIFLCSTCVLHIFQRKAVEYALAIMHLNRTDALELAKPTIGMSTTELLALTTVSK